MLANKKSYCYALKLMLQIILSNIEENNFSCFMLFKKLILKRILDDNLIY